MNEIITTVQKWEPIYLWNLLQGSEDWDNVRKGIPTASKFGQLLTPAHLKPSASQTKYIYELIAETLPSYVPRCPSVAEMEGTEKEPEARLQYSIIRGVEVRECGFVYGDQSMKWGASPDGLIGDEGGCEFKCPEGHTHLEYLEKKVVPTAHRPQVWGNMFATGRDWWDWMSYHPDLPPVLVRTERDDKYMNWESKFKPVLESFLERLQKAKELLGV